MVFAFIYPLIFGVGMYTLLRLLPIARVPGVIPATIYNFGVAMLTVRSIFIGVLKIYGTTNRAMVHFSVNIHNYRIWSIFIYYY